MFSNGCKMYLLRSPLKNDLLETHRRSTGRFVLDKRVYMEILERLHGDP